MSMKNDVARVTPLFKSDDNFLVNNYRSVSVLAFIRKIKERHVFNSFKEYLDKKNFELIRNPVLDQSIYVKQYFIIIL